jgi:hypothetical protein
MSSLAGVGAGGAGGAGRLEAKLRASVLGAVAKEKQAILQARRRRFERQRRGVLERATRRRNAKRGFNRIGGAGHADGGADPFKRRRTTGREMMWNVRTPAPVQQPQQPQQPQQQQSGFASRAPAVGAAAAVPPPASASASAGDVAEPYQFPPLQNGGTVEDRRERAATRLYEALRADVPAHVVAGSPEDVADEDLCESLANRLEDHLYEACRRDVMHREYRNKCRALLTNLRRNTRLSLRLRTNDLSCAALLSMDNAAMATSAQSAWRASVLEEAKKDLRRPDAIPWADHESMACAHCREVGACQYVALAMGTSHKDETWGSAGDVSVVRWRCQSCQGEWKEDNS